jgi:hypothetical protein
LLSNRKCDPTNVYSQNTLHTSTYIHALPDIKQSICIANYKSINLNESGIDTWAVHMARHFVERARREARHRPLAAITQNIVDDSSSNITNAGKTAGTTGFSPRVDGVVDGAAYTRLEPDDECDEANLTAVLLHPWKASSGGNRGRCREGVTHGFLLLPWGNKNGGTMSVVLGRRLETPGAIWELRVEQSWGGGGCWFSMEGMGAPWEGE